MALGYCEITTESWENWACGRGSEESGLSYTSARAEGDMPKTRTSIMWGRTAGQPVLNLVQCASQEANRGSEFPVVPVFTVDSSQEATQGAAEVPRMTLGVG